MHISIRLPCTLLLIKTAKQWTSCSDQDTPWPSSTGCSSPPVQTLSPTSRGRLNTRNCGRIRRKTWGSCGWSNKFTFLAMLFWVGNKVSSGKLWQIGCKYLWSGKQCKSCGHWKLSYWGQQNTGLTLESPTNLRWLVISTYHRNLGW